MKRPKKVVRGLYLILQILTILLHYFVFFGLILSPIFAIIYTPWYIWLPIVTFVVRVPFSRNICPLSKLEGVWEEKQGKIPKPPLFMKFWIIGPIKYIMGKAK